MLSDRSIRVPPTTGGRPVYEKRRKNAYPIYIRYEIVDDQWYFQSKDHLASRTNFAHIKCSQVLQYLIKNITLFLKTRQREPQLTAEFQNAKHGVKITGSIALVSQ